MAAYPDMTGKLFHTDAAHLMGYAQLLERHLEYLKKRCAGCPYRNYGVDRTSIPGNIREPAVSSGPFSLDGWFYEEQEWAASYVHDLERRLYALKQGCKQCPYRDQEGSGCHDEVSD